MNTSNETAAAERVFGPPGVGGGGKRSVRVREKVAHAIRDPSPTDRPSYTATTATRRYNILLGGGHADDDRVPNRSYRGTVVA